MRHMYTVQYFSTIRTQEIMASMATAEKVETITPSEARGTGRDMYHMASLVGVI